MNANERDTLARKDHCRSAPFRRAKSIAQTINSLYAVESRVDDAYLLAQALDMAVNCAVDDMNITPISQILQVAAGADHFRMRNQCLENAELGDCQINGTAMQARCQGRWLQRQRTDAQRGLVKHVALRRW